MLTVSVRPSSCRRVGQLLDEGHPVRPRRRPRVATVGEGELLVVDVDAVEVVVGGERRRWCRRGAARWAGSARIPAITPASVPSRIDATSGTPLVARGRRGTRSACVGRDVGLGGDRVDARRPPPERRQLVQRVGACGQLRQGVLDRPVRRPGLHVERPRGRRRRGAVVVAAERGDGDGDGGDRGERAAADDRRPPPAVVAGCAARRRHRRGRRASARYVPRSRGVTSLSVGTTTRPGAGSIGTMFGTATTTHPAAPAEATPVGESSMATHSAGIDAEAVGGQQVRLGVRLAAPDLVAGDDGLEPDRRQLLDDRRRRAGATTS